MAAFFWSDGFENDKFKSVPLVHLPIINRLRKELGGDYSCYRKSEVENKHNSLLFSACQGRQTSQCTCTASFRASSVVSIHIEQILRF